MRRLRLSTISFLNTRPITYGIERGLVGKDRFELSFDLPARCAAAVMSGEADLGLMPIASYGASTTGLRIVPGIAIASRGPVRTVMLMGEVPREEMTSVVLDGASRTSQLLVQLLLRERGLAPALEHADHDRVVERIGGKRGGLLIGDLCFAATRRFPYVYDLGAEWSERIGLPFVYAAWIGRPDVLASGDVALLQESLAQGLRNRPEIARLWAAQSGEDAALGERYLTENIHYALGARELCGAAAFLERAHAAGFLDKRPVLRMFPSDARASQVQQGPAPRPRECSRECSIDGLLSDAAAGTRLAFDDGVRLYEAASLYDLGLAADARRRALHPPGVVTYIIDRNVNYTNACTTACQFCNFYRPPGDDRIYTLTRDELGHKLRETVELGGIQVLLQGGVNPELGLDYFEDSVSLDEGEFSRRHPRAFARGGSPTGRARGADHRERPRTPDCRWARLGAGRRRGDPRRRDPAAYLAAQVLGGDLAGGHAPGPWPGPAHHRDHGVRLRREGRARARAPRQVARPARRDRGFHRLHLLEASKPRAPSFPLRDDTTATRYLRTLALARLYLDNFPNMQVSWVTMGPAVVPDRAALRRQRLRLGDDRGERRRASRRGLQTVGRRHRALHPRGRVRAASPQHEIRVVVMKNHHRGHREHRDG